MAPQISPPFSSLRAFIEGSPTLMLGLTLLIVASFVRYVWMRSKKLDLPIVGRTEDKDHRHNLVDGIATYPNSPFIIPTRPEIVILPPTVIDEVRNLPENKVSFIKEVQRMFFTKHTGIGAEGDAVGQVVKGDLTRHIASTLDALQDEVRYGFDHELEACEDWTAVQIYPKMARIVALLSGRVFVGRPLSREQEWISATVSYTFHTMMAKSACEKYAQYPVFIQNLIMPHLKPVKDLAKFKARGGELMKPLLDAHLSKTDDEKVHLDEGFQDEQGTFIGWLLSHMHETERKDPLALANCQMGLSFAAIHTTTMAVTAVIYDLCAHASYIPILREEIETIIAEDGYENSSGLLHLKKSSIPRLWKLDSFLKESQRFTPPGLVANSRVTTAPLALSTGHTLPIGTRLAFPSWSIHHSELSSPLSLTDKATLAPEQLPLPIDEFDGLRFYKLRKLPGNENRHQFVTTSSESLAFGYGIHACPGRFFAGSEIKVVLIELLRSWEMRLLEGTQRPENGWREFSCLPNTTGKVEMRRRVKA